MKSFGELQIGDEVFLVSMLEKRVIACTVTTINPMESNCVRIDLQINKTRMHISRFITVSSGYVHDGLFGTNDIVCTDWATAQKELKEKMI